MNPNYHIYIYIYIFARVIFATSWSVKPIMTHDLRSSKAQNQGASWTVRMGMEGVKVLGWADGLGLGCWEMILMDISWKKACVFKKS